ncbi:hypothetical protein HU719_003020 [Pseudomonas sp. SWRI107]|uniref:hypothetical protein n=1 Tax=Pseudomonas farsensis TaxID=2745492 RepID=UPI00164943F9|nr:hypothetical protein [Pseudomonas farsensis]MBV4530413.1 hypothetical protein [Pseudomonas farsensis]
MPMHDMEMVISCADPSALPPGNTLEIKLAHKLLGVVHREYRNLDDLKNSGQPLVVMLSADIPEPNQNNGKPNGWLVAWVGIAGFNEWFVMAQHYDDEPPSRWELELQPNNYWGKNFIDHFVHPQG